MTAASSRAYRPMISPGSTTSPISSCVSRAAPSVAVSSTSRKPPGCAHHPRPGSKPRRMQHELARLVDRERRHDEPRVDVGDVAARLADQAIPLLARERAELEPPAAPVQWLSVAASQGGGPPPAGRSVERPSGPATRRRRSSASSPRSPRMTLAAPITMPIPSSAAATQASRNIARPRSTGHHAFALRQKRSAASPVVITKMRRGDERAELHQRARQRDARVRSR